MVLVAQLVLVINHTKAEDDGENEDDHKSNDLPATVNFFRELWVFPPIIALMPHA